MKEFITIIMDGLSPVLFFSYCVYAYLGLTVYLGIDLWGRDPQSDNTPIKFSWSHWWVDNRWRVALSSILIPVFILISSSVLDNALDLHNAFMIGFAIDVVIGKLKKKGFVKNK